MLDIPARTKQQLGDAGWPGGIAPGQILPILLDVNRRHERALRATVREHA